MNRTRAMKFADRLRANDGQTVTGLGRLAILLMLITIAWQAGDGVLGALQAPPASEPDSVKLSTVVAALLAYVALMALPFCPGIEVGLALIVLIGREIVPFVYAATVGALLLAFVVGRFVPPQMVIETLGVLRLARARNLLAQIEPLDDDQRLRFLLERGSPRLSRWLLEHRYVAVAIALNTPGNLVLGDGGGIALAAGFSRLFSLRAFVLTVALAVAPLPVALLLIPR
ncbi:MAG TPA: hypothetical protein VFR86_31500 [Burkholderiaceae bacterium]|nr:hypothetical protein [Burkholderiaceae bacterium]